MWCCGQSTHSSCVRVQRCDTQPQCSPVYGCFSSPASRWPERSSYHDVTLICAVAIPDMPLVSENVLCKCTNKQRSWSSTRCPPFACLLRGSMWSPAAPGQGNHHKNHQIPFSLKECSGRVMLKEKSVVLLVPTNEFHQWSHQFPTPPPKHSSGRKRQQLKH